MEETFVFIIFVYQFNLVCAAPVFSLTKLTPKKKKERNCMSQTVQLIELAKLI